MLTNKIKCNFEESQNYLCLIKEGKELPKGITYIYLDSTDRYLFYKDLEVSDSNFIKIEKLDNDNKITSNEINDKSDNKLLETILKQNDQIIELNKKQTELLNTIKNCQLFFFVLTIIPMIIAFISVFIMVIGLLANI